MGRVLITLNTRYERNGVAYAIRELMPNRKLLVERLGAGDKEVITRDELVTLWANNEIVFEVVGPNARKPKQYDEGELSDGSPGGTTSLPRIATRYTFADFEELPEKYQDEAWRRYQIILPLIVEPEKYGKPDDLIAYVDTLKAKIRQSYDLSSPQSIVTGADGSDDEPTPVMLRRGGRAGIKLGMALSVSSVKRWRRAFLESGGDKRSLVPEVYNSGGPDEHRLPGVKERAIDEVLAECKAGHTTKRTTTQVHLMVVRRVLELTLEQKKISNYPFDRYSIDEYRLHELRRHIQADHDAYSATRRLEQQLRDHIDTVRRSCETAKRRERYDDLVRQLNELTGNALGEPYTSWTPDYPSETTVYRRIQEVGPEGILSRHRSSRQNLLDRAIGQREKPPRDADDVEFDWTPVDALVVDDNDRMPIGRPLIGFGRGRASGMPWCIVMGFGAERYALASRGLLHGILPKADVCAMYGVRNLWSFHGGIVQMTTDLGPATRSDFGDFARACGDLHITHNKTKVRMPWLKGGIERAMRDNNEHIFHVVPGTTFSNLLERDEYDSMKNACITWSGMWRLLHIYPLNYYIEDWHKGIGPNQLGGVPKRLWEQQMQQGFEPILYNNAREIPILVMPSRSGVTLQAGGFAFENLMYNSDDLIYLRSQLSPAERREMRFKYDPYNISAIYVLNPIEKDTFPWIRVPAIHERYAEGLSLYKHHRVLKHLRDEKRQSVDIYALVDGLHMLQSAAEKEFKQRRGRRTRVTAARTLGIGDAPTPSTGGQGSAAMPGDTDVKALNGEVPTSPRATAPNNTGPNASGSDSASAIVPPAKVADALDLTGFSADIGMRPATQR
jgi:hypothetical protein